MKNQPNHRKLFGATLVLFLTMCCNVPSHAEQNTPTFITVGLKYLIKMSGSGASRPITVTVLEASNQWIKVREGNATIYWLNTALATTIEEAK